MDIKLISNDNEPEEKEKEEIKPEMRERTKASGEKRTEGKVKKSGGVLLFLGVILLVSLCYVFLSDMLDYQRLYPEDLFNSNYYDVQESLLRYTKNVNRYYLYYGGARFDEEREITAADKEEYQARQLRLLMEEEAALEEEYRWQGIDEQIYKEKNRELEKLRNKYDVSYLQMEEEILEEKIQNYSDIKEYLSDMQDTFQYYLYNEDTLTAYSSIPGVTTNINSLFDLENVGSAAQDYMDSYCYFSLDLEDSVFARTEFNGVPLAASFRESGFKGFIVMPYGSELVTGLQDYVRRQDLYHAYSIIALVASFILLVALLVFCFSLRLKSFVMGNALLYGLYMKQPFFMKLFASGALCLLVLFNPFIPIGVFFNLIYYNDFLQVLVCIGFYFACALYLVLSLEYGVITIRNMENLKEEPEFRFFKGLKQDVREVWKTGNRMIILLYAALLLLMAVGTLIIGFMVIYFIFDHEPEVSLVFLICYFAIILIPIMLCRFIVGYARTVNAIHSMAEGRFEAITPAKGAFAKPLLELAGLEEGLQKSIAEAVKSQRLKSELITNVSHDLKTPLTSIINYVDLLKKSAGFSNDRVALDYIDVLEKKSRRLQVLIEDLFEASKLNSGSAELTPEVVDLVDLLKQTLGEMSEKIEASSVIFRVNYEKEHIYAYVDGKKIWRVFENLLNNILKYSQPSSRAYLAMEEKNDIVEIVFKNVSAYEINFDPGELFERFKRGDDSRSTEGSGLGLSIARSIVELHNGNMEIVVDGDLFKVVIKLAKAG